MTERKAKRSFNEMFDEPTEGQHDHKKENIVSDLIVTDTKVEMIPFSNVNLNYKNKRVITQLIRLIPDTLSLQALAKEDPVKYIIANMAKVPINNIQQEFNKAGDGDAILEYPNHSDLYDVNKEGIFIGKGICFSNINTDDKNIKVMIDDYVERVVRHGSSLASNHDVVEKPQIMQTGGQRFKLIYGHQRFTYLIYYYGLDHVYDFNLSMSAERQDLKIFLENNSKTTESGYEQLLSSYFTVSDLGLRKMEEIMLTLSISRSRYYQLADFFEDKNLLAIVKSSGINLSLKLLIGALVEVKKALKLLNITDREELYSRFEEKLLVLSKKNKKAVVTKKDISLSIPNDQLILEKLLFTDLREWDELNIDEYDLSDQKSIKRLFKKISEITNSQ
jgi:hypothetical protein|tara:strand:+ start:1177 stop:2349 length:1173 start_codon:yes stop_codon:yes gene_type:complete